MRIEVAPPASFGLLGRAPGLIPEWRVGAVLAATAVRDATTGQLWLNIGQARIPVRLASGDPSGPAHGESLRLRVLRNSPVIALEALETAASEDRGVTAEALRRALPGQDSPAALLANVGWLLGKAGQGQPLPRRVADAVMRLWQGLPGAAQLSDAAGLKAALARSGLFLESLLAGNTPAELLEGLLRHDLKALYLDLSKAIAEESGRQATPGGPVSRQAAPLPMPNGSLLPLGQTTPTLSASLPASALLDMLKSQADGALSRLTATQLLDVAAQGLACLIELPVRDGDNARMLRFRFAKEQERPFEQQIGWSVDAVMELRHGAAVHARVAFRSGRISVRLRSDSAAVVARLKTATAHLASALRTAGLVVEQIACLHGMPAADPVESRAQLVDLHAWNRNDNRPPVAVALHYRNVRAPRAVAEGEGLVAERIMARARAQDVPLQQDATLAGALAKLELHEAIPRELYVAVAEVLKFLWELDHSPHSEPTLLSQDSSPGPSRP